MSTNATTNGARSRIKMTNRFNSARAEESSIPSLLSMRGQAAGSFRPSPIEQDHLDFAPDLTQFVRRVANMQDENIVRDLYVSDVDRTIKASYFVESGIIHAHIDGRILTLPIGTDGSEEGLRRLLIGQAHVRNWRARFAERWIS